MFVPDDDVVAGPLTAAPFRPPVLPPEIPGARALRGLSYATPAGFRELKLDLFIPTTAQGRHASGEGSVAGAAGSRLAEGPFDTILFIHGGGFLTGDRAWVPDSWEQGELFAQMIARGYAVASMDYRHICEGTFPAQFHDTRAAIRYLRLYAADLGLSGRIVAWGESGGSILASHTAVVPPGSTIEGWDFEGLIGAPGQGSGLAAAVLWYGVSTRSMFAGFSANEAAGSEKYPDGWLVDAVKGWAGEPLDRTNPAAVAQDLTAFLGPANPPMLLIHGLNDNVVPCAMSRAFAQKAQRRGADLRYTEIPGAGHWFKGVPVGPIAEQSLDFLDEVLGR